jgi:propionyl-CoA carboxylase alpha chain
VSTPLTREFGTLLIANRGEIARRVIRTARGMGLRTVAVHSDEDAGAPHVRDADVAVPLGGSTAAESYLDATSILDAARRAGADAVHPGYGFLSENAPFAEACAQAGLVFVGPSPEAIRRMGLKHEAKEAARAAGVPVLPDAALFGDRGRTFGRTPGEGGEGGEDGEDGGDGGDGEEDWLLAAKAVGYPLLVKASAGGGGRGMRLVTEPGGLAEAVRGARREAASAFGDGRVFLERYLPAARHVELQVFGDAHGTVVHLGERECSVQRRHQKIVEECPSPAVSAGLRERMGATAVALAAALRYTGAGTVEYLLGEGASGEPEFFFLEMNTRLQVEHPVTEEVMGYDLVRLQLEIAAGRPLPLRQQDVRPRGHAIEVRLYAEDPAAGFAPAFGSLDRYEHDPAPGLRYEDGVASGTRLTPFFDPMLAKVVAHADTRSEAARRLRRALARMRLHGAPTNRDMLVALLAEPDFLAGRTRTDYLDLHPGLLEPAQDRPGSTPPHVHLAAALAVSVHRRRAGAAAAAFAPPGWRLGALRTGGGRATWARSDASGDPVPLTYELDAAGGDALLTLDTGDGVHRLRLRDLGPDGARVLDEAEGIERHCAVYPAAGDGGPGGGGPAGGVVWVNDPDTQTAWRELPRFPVEQRPAAAGGPVSQVPGTVVAVLVAAGDRVTAGQPLVVLEAMKMEHRALAPTDGVVDRVEVEVGQYVEAHQVLVTLADRAAAEPGDRP